MCLKIIHLLVFNNSTHSNNKIPNQQINNDIDKVYIIYTHVEKINTSNFFLSFQDHFQQQSHFMLQQVTNAISIFSGYNFDCIIHSK